MVFLALKVITIVLVTISIADASPNCHRRVISINPQTIFNPEPFGYKHIALDTSNLVAYIAGQVSVDLTGAVIGTTLAQQLTLVEKNLLHAMDAVDADIGDIMQVMTFVKDYDKERDLPVLTPVFQRLGAPVHTLVSTPSLAFPDLLVEIQAIIAVPRGTVETLVGPCKKLRSFGRHRFSSHRYSLDEEPEVVSVNERDQKMKEIVD